MFCPNCGNEVKDGDLFCGECGTKIEPMKGKKQEIPKQEIPRQETPKQKAPKQENPKQAPETKKKTERFTGKDKKIVIAEIAVLVILVAAFFYFGSRSSSPQSAANQFVKDYNNKNWSKVYDSFNYDEDTFINEETFEKTMDQSETKTLSAPTGGYTSNSGMYAGQYTFLAKKGNDTITIRVAKSAKKNFLFFDKYEVVSAFDSGMRMSTVRLFTIPGVTVKVDGIAAKVPSDTNGNTYYTKMFSGTHKITLLGDDDMFTQKTYTFNTDDTNPLSKIKYSSTAKTEAAKALKSYLPAITEAKIKDKDKSVLSTYFTSAEKASSYGGSLCSYIYYYGKDTRALGNVKLTKCRAEDLNTSYGTVADGIPVSVLGTRDYEAKMWSGSYQKQTCQIKGVAKMLKKNGKWLIDSVSYYYY